MLFTTTSKVDKCVKISDAMYENIIVGWSNVAFVCALTLIRLSMNLLLIY